MSHDTEQDIMEMIDLVDFTLSNQFLDKWKYKYSPKFIKVFQENLLTAFKKQKPLKVKTLTNILKKNNKYSEDQISNFYESIDLSLYYPIIYR